MGPQITEGRGCCAIDQTELSIKEIYKLMALYNVKLWGDLAIEGHRELGGSLTREGGSDDQEAPL